MSTGNLKKFQIIFLLLLLALAPAGCLQENDYHPPGEDPAFSFTREQARQFFHSQNQVLSFPLVNPSLAPAKSPLYCSLLAPDWEQVRPSRMGDIITYEIPLQAGRDLSGIFTRSGAVNVVSTLVIQKHTALDSIRQFVATAIGYEKDAAGNSSYNHFEPGRPDACFTYTGNKQHFSGLVILSEVSGRYLRAYYYLNGKSYRVHLESGQSRSGGLFGVRIYMGEPQTKWAGGYEGYHYCYHCHSEEQFYGGICSRCGQGNQLDEITVYPNENYECPEHGWAPCDCKNDLKCPFCGNIPCTCDACPCGDPWCAGGLYCTHQGPDPDRPSEGGPDGGGGGGGGGSPQNPPQGINSIRYGDEKSREEIKPVLNKLNNDLMGKRLLNALADRNISIQYNPDLNPLAQYKADKDGRRIEWFAFAPLTELQLLEELVHALQHKNGSSRPDNKINMEVEAKIAQYKYAVKNGMKDELYGLKQDWDSIIGDYIKDTSAVKYQAIVEFIRRMSSTYQDTNAFADHPDYRNTNNIDVLFIDY